MGIFRLPKQAQTFAQLLRRHQFITENFSKDSSFLIIFHKHIIQSAQSKVSFDVLHSFDNFNSLYNFCPHFIVGTSQFRRCRNIFLQNAPINIFMAFILITRKLEHAPTKITSLFDVTLSSHINFPFFLHFLYILYQIFGSFSNLSYKIEVEPRTLYVTSAQKIIYKVLLSFFRIFYLDKYHFLECPHKELLLQFSRSFRYIQCYKCYLVDFDLENKLFW